MNDPQDVHPVVGHHAAWGLTTSRAQIQPYNLTAGSIDTMCVRVREKIDIHGVGTDVVTMEGSFTVRRDHPCAVGDAPEPRWGEACVKTEFRSLELSGQSPVFGTVRVHLDPAHVSHGEVGPSEEGSIAASCVAHCYPTIEMPELGLKLTTRGEAVTLASKVVQIPPVGDVARSDNSAPLVDEGDNVVGEIVSSDIEVGEIVCSFPLGSTKPPGENGHDHDRGNGEHTRHWHPDPSGPSFYAEAPPQPARAEPHPHDHPHPHDRPHGRDATHAPVHPGLDEQDIASTLTRLEDELRTLTELIRDLAQRR